MQIVIDIPDNIMEYLRNNGCLSVIYTDGVAKAIINGTPLPKGHGRLVDENDLVKDFNTFQDAFMINVAHAHGFRVVCKAPTIIEADKESDNADSN